MTTDLSPLDVVADPSATDPLTDVTRSERKALLVACVIAVSIAAGGLVPEEIEALGITVAPAQERSLLYLLVAVIVYFVFGFSIYAASDLNRRRVAIAQARGKIAPLADEAKRLIKEAQEEWDGGDTEGLLQDERFKRVATLSDQMKLAQRVSSFGTLRIVFDVWLPIVIGISSAAVVLAKTRGFPGWLWVAVLTGLAIVAGLAVLTWKTRRIATRWWRRQKSTWRSWRFKRFMTRANTLSKDDPRRTELLAEAKKSLMRSVDDFAPERKSDRAQPKGSSGRLRRR